MGGYNMTTLINEINSSEYACPLENEVSVFDIPMSKRLQNILKRYNILYLSQLSSFPKEKILMLRNMGQCTMAELDAICQKYGTQIHSLSSIKEAFIGCKFSNILYEILFQNNIFCPDDFAQKSANDLYIICKHDYMLTMEAYYALKENGVVFDKWQDKYIFEILPKTKAISLWQKYSVSAKSQLSNYSKPQFKKIITMFPELSDQQEY